jgi:hypothetical protein
VSLLLRHRQSLPKEEQQEARKAGQQSTVRKGQQMGSNREESGQWGGQQVGSGVDSNREKGAKFLRHRCLFVCLFVAALL